MSLTENRRIALEREPGTIRECYCGAVVRVEGEQKFEYDGGFGCYVNPVEHHCLTAEVTITKPAETVTSRDIPVTHVTRSSSELVMPARTHQE